MTPGQSPAGRADLKALLPQVLRLAAPGELPVPQLGHKSHFCLLLAGFWKACSVCECQAKDTGQKQPVPQKPQPQLASVPKLLKLPNRLSLQLPSVLGKETLCSHFSSLTKAVRQGFGIQFHYKRVSITESQLPPPSLSSLTHKSCLVKNLTAN